MFKAYIANDKTIRPNKFIDGIATNDGVDITSIVIESDPVAPSSSVTFMTTS